MMRFLFRVPTSEKKKNWISEAQEEKETTRIWKAGFGKEEKLDFRSPGS